MLLIEKNLMSCLLFLCEMVVSKRELLQVQGIVQDRSGKTVATLVGKWDESMHYVNGDCSGKGKGSDPFSEAHILWKRSKPPKYPTRYNLTRFAMTMNELTPGLKVRRIILLVAFFLWVVFPVVFRLEAFIYCSLFFRLPKLSSRKNCHQQIQD